MSALFISSSKLSFFDTLLAFSSADPFPLLPLFDNYPPKLLPLPLFFYELALEFLELVLCYSRNVYSSFSCSSWSSLGSWSSPEVRSPPSHLNTLYESFLSKSSSKAFFLMKGVDSSIFSSSSTSISR